MVEVITYTSFHYKIEILNSKTTILTFAIKYNPYNKLNHI